MPNSNESSESEFSNENQQNIINRNTSLVRSGSKTLINGTRHQQYSKNVYIGTRNAEKWENIRSNLAFKNDVEFVSYLLSLAEKEQQKNVGVIPNKPDDLPIVLTKPLNTSRPVSPTELIIPPKKIKKVKFHEPTELEVDSQPTPEKKKSRRSSSRNKKAHDGDLNFRKKIIPPPESLVELKTDNILSDNAEEVLDCRIEEKRKSDFLEQQIRQDSLRDSAIESAPYPIIEEALDKNVDEENAEILCLAMKKLDEIPSIPKTTEELEHFPKKRRRRGEPKAKKGENRSRNKNNKHDIRKAPMDAKIVPSQDEIIGNEFEEHIRHPLENIVVTEKLTMNHDTASEDDDVDDDSSNCRDCNTKHNKNDCQIRDPIDFIDDPVKYSDWLEDNKHLLEEDKPSFDHLQIKSEDLEEDEENDDNDDDIENDDSNETSSNISATEFAQNFATVKKNVEHTEIVPSFSEVSLPSQFELMLNDELGIVTKVFLPKYTQLGPLIGETISEIDIADDCNMKLIFETFDGIKSNFLSAENKNKSNWLRYMRPASTRDLRNATLIFKDNHIYFITCNDIEAGCELLYWSDENNSAWDKKKIDRLNCGGCNIKFDHPLYYRTHCSVFHDSTFSLTIRKYHCKICGIAVLGKENIMKHAAQMHEGKGAYQCQYCKKFFLRLNYLEMHRTYGCSANPQRARPLCDFCGRKFCQPQKLKVHIKRMHSDMAEVLRDFQCKLCSKLLGSRAALQRHSKEVHSRNSTVVSCPRCQKLFQNRSNLKIHMLTHSGVRPFKCIETECNAAFTTKQCLQFHYKKVHGYTQDQMPKIERSVAYTFDAYSGGIKVDMSAEQASRRRRRSLDYDSSLANETEENEMNKFAMPNKGANDLLKQHQASMSEICKNETNLSLFSTTISSFLNQEIHRDNLDRDVSDVSDDDIEDDGIDSQVDEDEAHPDETDYVAEKEMHNSVGHIKPPQIETHQQNAQLSLVESFLSETSSRLNLENHDELSMMSAASNNNIEKDHDNYRINETMCNVGPNTHQNLVASKGSKKWINTELNDASDMSVNRDFLSKLIMSGNNQCDDNDDDDNSTILDVVETNQNQYNSPSLGIDTADTMQQIQHIAASPQLHHHQSNLVSGFYNNNRQIGSISTSASMLVEAALNSVSNMIDNENDVKNCASNTSEDNNISSLNISHNNSNVDHHMAHVDFENTRNYNQSSYIQSPIPNNLILKEANNDIDVDSVSTPNENFPHHATPSPRAISPGQDYPLNMYSATTSNSHHHVALENCRRGYSMMQENHIEGSDSPQSLPRYDFSGIPRRKSDGSHQISHLSSDDENSIIVAQNLSINNNQDEMKVKMPHAQQLDLLYSKYNNEGQGNLSHEENVNNLTENRMKYSNNSNHAEQNGMDIAEFRSNSSNETISDFQGVDMSSRSLIGGYHNSSSFQIPTSGVNLSINRYHHQIYDILSDRDQQTNDQHQLQQQQQMQHIMQDQINDDPPDQSTSVDLSRSGNYSVSSPPPPPPPLPYSHPHSDMLRMVSLDLTPNSGAGMLSHSHLRHSTSLLSSHQMQHNPRDSLSVEAHNRLISTEQLTSNHRLIVDPTTHLLMEQNNRILSENNRSILDQTSRLLVDPTANRHMVPSRGFGAYHHQVATSNFHHSTRGGLPSPHSGNPSNYHPFSAYY